MWQRGVVEAKMGRGHWDRYRGMLVEDGGARHGGMLEDRTVGEERCRKAMSIFVSLGRAIAGGGEARSRGCRVQPGTNNPWGGGPHPVQHTTRQGAKATEQRGGGGAARRKRKGNSLVPGVPGNKHNRCSVRSKSAKQLRIGGTRPAERSRRRRCWWLDRGAVGERTSGRARELSTGEDGRSVEGRGPRTRNRGPGRRRGVMRRQREQQKAEQKGNAGWYRTGRLWLLKETLSEREGEKKAAQRAK